MSLVHANAPATLPALEADFGQEAANEAWLRAHKDHHLYYHWALLHDYDPVFARTCCEVTACRLAEQLNGTPLEEWHAVDAAHWSGLDLAAPVSVIEFGDHWFVLCDGVVYQSVWRVHGPRRGYLNATQMLGLAFGDVRLFLTGRRGAPCASPVEMRQYFPPPRPGSMTRAVNAACK